MFATSCKLFSLLTNECCAALDVYVREQEEVAQESESEDEEQAIYNPLKLPMGWDGKPIPYWLYKLHGLGQVGPVFSIREFSTSSLFI